MSREEAWDFFSRPENLDTITPDDLSFEIISDVKDKKMYPGMMILYKVSPFKGIKMNWCTEISHVRKPFYFVDEQRTGPYSIWHHEHHFEEVEDGILMTDILHYAVPFGLIGRIANYLVVDRKINHIFEHRKRILSSLFKPKMIPA